MGGGGNTSVKLRDHILVKASGTALSGINSDGFVDLDRAALEALLDRDLGPSRLGRETEFKAAILASRRAPGRGQRPSVESLLHHLMPGTFVAHLHANLVNQFSCCREGKRLVLAKLGGQVSWVDLVDPGFALAKALQVELAAFARSTGRPGPKAVILQNHGLVVSGSTPDEVTGNVDWLLASLDDLKAKKRRDLEPGRRIEPTVAHDLALGIGRALEQVLTGDDGHRWAVVFDGSDEVASFAGAKNGRALAMRGPLTPDQIVYCRSFPLWLALKPEEPALRLTQRLARAVEEYSQRHGSKPAVVVVERLGMFACGRGVPEAEIARAVYADAIAIMTGALQLGGVMPLDEDFTNFIETWEVEAYRQGVSGCRNI